MSVGYLEIIGRVTSAAVPEEEAVGVLADIESFGLRQDERSVVLGLIAFGMKNSVLAERHLLNAIKSEDIQLSGMAKALLRGLNHEALISDGPRLRSAEYGMALEKRIPELLAITKIFIDSGAPDIAQSLLSASYMAILEWQCINHRYRPLGGIWDVISPTISVLRMVGHAETSMHPTTKRIAEHVLASSETSSDIQEEVQSLLVSFSLKHLVE